MQDAVKNAHEGPIHGTPKTTQGIVVIVVFMIASNQTSAIEKDRHRNFAGLQFP